MPKVEQVITTGNLISISAVLLSLITTIVYVGSLYGQLRAELAYQHDQIVEIKQTRDARRVVIDAHLSQLDAAVAGLSVQSARTDTSISDIRAGIARIEAKLGKMEDRDESIRRTP